MEIIYMNAHDWVKHHRLMVDAWENRRNLIVQSDLVENYSMRYDYETWYDSITRRFISPIEPQQIDYGYQPGDAYFRRIVRYETSNLKNMFGGLSVDDQSREALVEVVKKTIQTCDLLYEMSFRTPEQQHHHARSSNRRRRLIDDDVADEPSFSTPDWQQSMSTQSPTIHSMPHSSHVDDSSHGTTTQLPVTLGWASSSHGEGTSHGDSVFRAPLHSYIQSFELYRFSSIGSKKALAEVPASSLNPIELNPSVIHGMYDSGNSTCTLCSTKSVSIYNSIHRISLIESSINCKLLSSLMSRCTSTQCDLSM
ncbi:uncharacterized protein [Primulina eburnea]|uniref:uncharacterized protein isoform X2 n=1 Tax=Primulina eburnea TaxID=1245227 RepID=UPI003C6C5FDE